MTFDHWRRRITQGGLPAYQLIPELIAEDLQHGRLAPRQRLPPLRELAREVELDYTTVVRGVALARERGLIASRPGLGTYTRGSFIGLPLRAGTGGEMTMNQPPELEGHPVLETLRQSAIERIADVSLPDLMRYQDFGGTGHDRAVASQWLGRWLPMPPVDRVLVAPGIHAALVALVSLLVRPGRSLAVERLSYPGIKAIAAQLGIQLHPLDMDDEGLVPEAFEDACRSVPLGAVHLCPNLHNPTTATLSIRRREQIADIASRYSVPIIEDDAYGMLPPAIPPPMADLVPELTYYIAGMSKWLGAGLRIAYVVSPTAGQQQKVAGALRATTVMASAWSASLVTRWLERGQGDLLLDALREECAARVRLVRDQLGPWGVRTQPHGFHAWLPVPDRPGGCAGLAARLRGLGIAAVAASAFSTDRDPPSALRLCLGGSLTREDCGRALAAVAEAIGPPGA